MKKRARLTDENDPLTPTDRVLARFERISQSGIQEASNTRGQEVSKPESQQVSKPASWNADNPAGQEAKKSLSLHVNQSESQEASGSATQQAGKLKLRKSTFQLGQPILERLDTFHLQLQLEMGKANAPYKEVIVEEAISQLLDEAVEDRTKLLAALQERQTSRN